MTKDVAGTYSIEIDGLSGDFTVSAAEEKGEAGGCWCSTVGAQTSTSELMVGWGVIGLCWGTGYWLVRRVSRRRRR